MVGARREQFVGQPLILRYLARAGTKPHALIPQTALEATQVSSRYLALGVCACPQQRCAPV